MPQVSAIVITHNNCDQVAGALASLDRSQTPIDEVIVIDHASIDGTVDRLRREFPRALVLGFCDNPGFGEGNNRGARVASGDYLLLLNPDAAVDGECVGHLLRELESDPRLGIAVPKVLLAAERSILNSAGLLVNIVGHARDRGYLEWDAGQFDRPEPILAGSGCALLVRATTFRAVGGFDPAYFLYYEDLDLCWRSWIAGWSVSYVPAAIATHAMKVSGRPDLYNHYLDHRNRVRTLLKNMSGRSLLRALPQILLFETGMVHLARPGRWQALWFRLRAWLWNLWHLPDTLRRRRAVQKSRMKSDLELAPLFQKGRGPRGLPPLQSYAETYDTRVDAHALSNVATMGHNDVGALGLGWSDVETFQGERARACASYGIVFLRAPAIGAQDAPLQVSCSAPQPVYVNVRTDREHRGRFAVVPDRWQTIEVSVPLKGPVIRIELLVEATRETGHAGRRASSGLMVRRLGLFP